MFNNYAVRPIGSDRFLEHLKDIQTTQFYATELLQEESDISVKGSVPWMKPDYKHIDGWDELWLAYIALLFIDYLEDYKKKLIIEEEEGQSSSWWIWNSRCIVLENDYFRRNHGFIEMCFDKMLENVWWEGIDAIDKCIKRFYSFLRWTRPARKTKKEEN